MLSETSTEFDVRAALRDFFRPGYAVSMRWDLVGMSIENGYVVFGASIGYLSSGIKYLAHEMAHFVEIDENRCRQVTWGLRTPMKFIGNQLICEPQTLQMTRRELRVCALQSNFLDAFGFQHTITDLTDPLRYLPDYYLVPARSEAERVAWYAQQAMELKARPQFSFKTFERIWRRRAAA